MESVVRHVVQLIDNRSKQVECGLVVCLLDSLVYMVTPASVDVTRLIERLSEPTGARWLHGSRLAPPAVMTDQCSRASFCRYLAS